MFLVQRTHIESQILLPRGNHPRYCLLTCLLLLRGRREYPRVLPEGLNTPWAGLPIPPRPVRPVLRRYWPPTGLAGGSQHPLGWTPRPPQAGAPGSQKKMAPQWPCRRLRTAPGLGSQSPEGRCARFYVPAGPARRSDHPLGWTPCPPRPVCLVLRPHRPCRTLRAAPVQDSPSPHAGVPGCPYPQALPKTPATPWAGIPIPPGRCARFYVTTGPAGRSDHPLGLTPHPPRLVGPVVHPRRPCGKLRPPAGLDSPSPQTGVHGSTPPQAPQNAQTTPWVGLSVPPGRWARLSIPTGAAGNSDQPLGWTPHPPRPVCPVLHPRRPCRTLRPPPGKDSSSPQAGVPGSTPPQAPQDARTTPWAGLPVPPGRCTRM